MHVWWKTITNYRKFLTCFMLNLSKISWLLIDVCKQNENPFIFSTGISIFPFRFELCDLQYWLFLGKHKSVSRFCFRKYNHSSLQMIRKIKINEFGKKKRLVKSYLANKDFVLLEHVYTNIYFWISRIFSLNSSEYIWNSIYGNLYQFQMHLLQKKYHL